MKPTPIKVPKDKQLLLISGIPGCGKTTFCRYSKNRFNFTHYDMENPEEWPHPQLHSVWNYSRKKFIRRLKELHDRVVLDWGFPPSCISLIFEMQAEGVRIVWFKADINAARRIFNKRGTVPSKCFEIQIEAIDQAGLPCGLGAIEVNVLTRSGRPRKPEAIAKAIFAAVEC